MPKIWIEKEINRKSGEIFEKGLFFYNEDLIEPKSLVCELCGHEIYANEPHTILYEAGVAHLSEDPYHSQYEKTTGIICVECIDEWQERNGDI